MKSPLFVVWVLTVVFARYAAVAVEPPPPPLDQIPAAMEQLSKDFQAKLENTGKVLETEASAGRISEPAAQLLRWTLQTSISATGKLQLRALISSSRLPTENAAIMAALTELEAANTQNQARRTALVNEANRAISARMAELLKTATQPAECEAFEKSVDTLRVALQGDISSTSASYGMNNAISLAQRLRRLLEAEASGNTEAVAQAVQNFRSSASMYGSGSLNLSVEIEERAARTTKPLLEAIAQSQNALDEAIHARKPASERSAALESFAAASAGYAPIQFSGMRVPGTDPRQALPFYRDLVQLLNGIDQGDVVDLASRVQQVQQALHSVEGPRGEKFRVLLSGLEKAAADRSAKEALERWSKLQSRLAAVTKPADLDAVAVDVAAWVSGARQRGRSDGEENWTQLSAELAGLAAAWAGPLSSALLDERYRDSQLRHPAVATTLRDLRKRIERDLLTRHLRAPELGAPPLAALETDTALDALADELTARGEWRRLLALLEARMNLQLARGRSAPDDAVMALRAFFAAQNFELAEQWADAAQTYKEVLRASSPRAPTAAAAEKLKALVKAHPEAAGRPTPEGLRSPGAPGIPTGR
jgi:hypothetical protein